MASALRLFNTLLINIRVSINISHSNKKGFLGLGFVDLIEDNKKLNRTNRSVIR
jgi:hypothetical protein